MDYQQKKDLLAKTKNDYVASAARSALGAVPFAGSLLIELADNTIPNQRMERVVKYVLALENRMAALDENFVKAQLLNENFSDLLEESVHQAARSLSDERRERIASLLTSSLSDEELEYAEAKHLLRLLGEISDVEVIWLRSYSNPTIGGDSEFRDRHEEVLKPILVEMGAGQVVFDKSTLQKSYKEHLARLGMLNAKYKPKDRITRLEVDGYEITMLGRMLLRYIDFAEEE